MAILNRFSEMFEEISTWRRDLHAHPELRFEEYRTAAFVASKLKEFGVDEIVTGFGGTGVVGVIHGQNNTSGRSIGFRADMDALPIQEVNDLPHASTILGKMHACGHDGHTSMLLGAALMSCCNGVVQRSLVSHKADGYRGRHEAYRAGHWATLGGGIHQRVSRSAASSFCQSNVTPIPAVSGARAMWFSTTRGRFV